MHQNKNVERDIRKGRGGRRRRGRRIVEQSEVTEVDSKFTRIHLCSLLREKNSAIVASEKAPREILVKKDDRISEQGQQTAKWQLQRATWYTPKGCFRMGCHLRSDCAPSGTPCHWDKANSYTVRFRQPKTAFSDWTFFLFDPFRPPSYRQSSRFHSYFAISGGGGCEGVLLY